jgi:predicted peptidase
MKRLLCCALLLVGLALPAAALGQATQPSTRPATRPALVIPQKPGTHRLSCTVSYNGQKMKLPFVLYLPTGYLPSGPKVPALVFLHGSGECGTDLDAIFYHGPNFELEKQGNDAFRKAFPMIVISPQCPPRGQRWDRGGMDQMLNLLLDEVLAKLNVDQDRIYATGLSMGGIGTWHMTAARPDRFAAIAPVSSVEMDPAHTAPMVKNVCVLAITGEGDMAQIQGSGHMVAAINKAGGFAETVIGPDGHMVWVKAYARPRTYEWLLLNSKGKPHPSVTPGADEGGYPDQPGFHHLAYASSAEAGHALDYVLYLPADYKPSDRRPMLIHLPDSRKFGTYRNGLVLHGPAQQAYDFRGSKAFPFILVQPMLPPFAATSADGRNETLAQLLKKLVDQYHPNPDQIYIAGSGDGAKLALAMSRDAGAPYAAAILDVPDSHPDFDGVNENQPVPTVVLGVTNSDKGPMHDRLNALVTHGTAGSDLAVLPQAAYTKGCFSLPDVYQRLLKIKRK